MRIGEALLKAGLVTEQQLQEALEEQKKTHRRLGDILLKNGVLSSEQFAPILGEYFRIPYINLKDIYKTIKPPVIDVIPMDIATRFTVLPIQIKNNILTIATFDPLDLEAIDMIRMKTGHKVQCVMSSEEDIMEAIEYCYKHLPRMDEYVESFIDLKLEEQEPKEFELQGQQYSTDAQPVVQYVRSMIVQAMNSRASDIHIKPKRDEVELKFRVDGVLQDMKPPPKTMLSAVNTRIKILAGIDIAERRLPQDGRFKVQIGKHEIDIRTSTFPTIYGESLVLRLLDTSAPLLGLEQLGLDDKNLQRFKNLLENSYGLILVTGPTGSGKTTSLYTALRAIDSKGKNIITLEDPVEYRMDFIQQSQVYPHIGFTFAKGLRSILRQDPDIIMVGEIRDRDTAEISIHAALTGHLVLATLHTNDATGAVVRLIHMGVEPFLVASSLLGVVAQRLVRKVCPHCVKTHKMTEELRHHLGLSKSIEHFSKGMGCDQCLDSGYKGRIGIFEVLVPDVTIREKILKAASNDEIREAAQKVGMNTLRESGIELLRKGITTPEEIFRVTQNTVQF